MIISTIRMAIPIELHSDALKIVRSLSVLSKDYPGCFSHYFYKDIEDSDVIMLQGIWRAEEDLERHISSEEYRNLLLVLEMSRKPPEIRFDTITSSTGIENIEKIRNTNSKL